MKEYLFFSLEGHTIPPRESIEVDNCQMLGRACGQDKKEALRNLLSDNAWISEAGFQPAQIKSVQILTNELRENVKKLIEAVCSDEQDHFKTKHNPALIKDLVKRLENCL